MVVLVLKYTSFFFLLSLVRPHSAQRLDFEVPDNQLNRRFAWSSELPLSSAVNELAPEVAPYVSLTTRHAALVEKALLESLQRPKVEPDAVIQPCDPKIPEPYLDQVELNFGIRGFLEPAVECATDVPGVKMDGAEEPGYTLEDLYNAVFNQGAAIQQHINDITVRVINNFTAPEAFFNNTFKTVSADCTLSVACMFREDENWHQGIGIHSNKKDHFLEDGKRQSIWEHVRAVDGKLGDPLRMRLPVYDDGKIERVILDNATTYIQGWNGAMRPFCFRTVDIAENPAMVDALDRTYHFTQQAEDVLTNSNLAILVLPLALNMIPISLVAKVNRKSLLLYTILSDVLTVIPLGIKGIELVDIGKKRFRSVITRMTSPAHGSTAIPRAAGGEIWAAECRVRQGAERTGTILIITSVVFLFFGILAEILARSYVRRRQLRWQRRRKKLRIMEDETLDGEPSSMSTSKSSTDTGFVLDCEVGAHGVKTRYSSDFEEKPKTRKKRVLFGS